MKVTKAKLAQEDQSKHSRLSRLEAKVAVDAFLRLIKKSLVEGEDALLTGFVKFRIRNKRSRMGRNPKTCESQLIDAHRVVTFRHFGLLRRQINA